jgi:hypothetical protein
MTADEPSPQPEGQVPQDQIPGDGAPEDRVPQAQDSPEPVVPEAIAPEAAAAQQSEQQSEPAAEQPMPQPQVMPAPAPLDPNAVSASTAILGTAPNPGAAPFPYPPNDAVPPFGAAAAQYAGFPPPPGMAQPGIPQPGMPQPGMPAPPYPAQQYPSPQYPAPPYPSPQYPYAPYGQQPMPGPGYPAPWPGYVPPPMGPPPRKRRAGAIGGIAAALIVVGAVVIAIAMTGSNSSPGLGASPAQSGAPQATNPGGIFPSLPTQIPTNIFNPSPTPFAFTLPTTAGPLTQMSGSAAQTVESPMQTIVNAEQQSLGGTLEVGAYQDDSSSAAVQAVVAGNTVAALPSLQSVAESDDYQDFINTAASAAHMQDLSVPQPGGYGGAMVCGGVPVSAGLVVECIWIDSRTFGLVEFSPAVANTSAAGWNVAISDGPQLRGAIEE